VASIHDGQVRLEARLRTRPFRRGPSAPTAHPEVSIEILRPLEYRWSTTSVITNAGRHGYPWMTGDSIPLGSRILAVVTPGEMTRRACLRARDRRTRPRAGARRQFTKKRWRLSRAAVGELRAAA
jgi:hypothetical protein